MYALCGSKKNPYLPQAWLFGLDPPPGGISSLASYITLTILVIETPSPSEFLMTIDPLGRYMYIFWNCTFHHWFGL